MKWSDIQSSLVQTLCSRNFTFLCRLMFVKVFTLMHWCHYHLLRLPIASDGKKFIIADANAATILYSGSRHLTPRYFYQNICVHYQPVPTWDPCTQLVEPVARNSVVKRALPDLQPTKSTLKLSLNDNVQYHHYPPTTRTPDARLTALLYSRFFSMFECSLQLW